MTSASQLSIQALTTRIFREGENLVDFIVQEVPAKLVKEKMILAVTSKIFSFAENRFVDKAAISKADLIDREADFNLGEVGYGCYLTVKEGLFIPSAGIDESNSEKDRYILYPADPFASAEKLWTELRKRWQIQDLGIVMTDSHTTPLRRGVTGISLAHWGFHAVKSMIGTPDLFGRKIQMTSVNIADGLAAAATLMMGEANECRPLAWIEHGDISFTEKTDPSEVKMPLKEDLYYPFFEHRLIHKR